MPDVAYVNGKVGPLREAMIPVQDRGFLLGDGVYEVMRTYGGRLFGLESHLDRLESSLDALRIPMPVKRPQLVRIFLAMLLRSRYSEARIYVQVTRGVAPRQHAFPKRIRPTLVVFVEKLVPMSEKLRRHGIEALTLRDPRWSRCDVKAITLLPNVLSKQAALDAGVHEAIFLGPDARVRECTTANVFRIEGETLQTHPLGSEILPGVSRSLVLRVAREAGLRVRERAFGREALYDADELFLSSTMQEILAIVRVDGKRIGSGRPGPVALSLYQRFLAATRVEKGGIPAVAPNPRRRRTSRR